MKRIVTSILAVMYMAGISYADCATCELINPASCPLKCSVPQNNTKSTVKQVPKKTAKESRKAAKAKETAKCNDERIVFSANNSYTFNTYLKDDSITILSKDCVVTLKGTVKEKTHILLAQEAVANLHGVKRVDNQLIFIGDRPAKNSDRLIGVKVKAALLFHRKVHALKTMVDVNDGVVTLKGEASSQAQKELTGEYAIDVEGVKQVVNNMTIADKSGIGQENRK